MRLALIRQSFAAARHHVDPFGISPKLDEATVPRPRLLHCFQ